MTEATAPQASTGFWSWLRALPRWKKLLLALALVLVAAGVVFAVVEAGRPAPAPPPAPSGGESGVRSSFLPGDPNQPAPPAATATEPASAGFFRLGFSFIAGFCIGLAVRKTLKLTAVVAG